MTKKEYKETFFFTKENTAEFVLGESASPLDAFLVDPAELSPKAHKACFELSKNGYTILKDVLTSEQVVGVMSALQPMLEEVPGGRNHFEGVQTQRVYSLPVKTRATDVILDHPLILEILSAHLLPNPLLTAAQAIVIHPGETPQPLHTDDGFMNIQRPHKPFSIATMFAITPFTADNGATVVYPGSHLWGRRLPTKSDEFVSMVMNPGDAAVFLSTTWHGGGQNKTQKSRFGITAQYCEPWIRPQENFMLGLLAANKVHELDVMSPSLISMLGFSIHPPFLGMVDGKHPLKAINRSKL